MPDSFFSKKRKRTGIEAQRRPTAVKKVTLRGGPSKKRQRDEELDSDKTEDSDEGTTDPEDDQDESGSEDANETPAEKRLRLARVYLDSLKEEMAGDEFDAAEIDRDIIATRLKQDVLENAGKVHLFVAENYDFSNPPSSVLRTRGHRFSVTSAVASEDGRWLFTAGKEGSIIKWDLQTGKQLHVLPKLKASGKGKGRATADLEGHSDEVFALALSSDGKFLVSGGKDRKVVVWNAETGKWAKNFLGHKDSISGLTFRKGSQQLYSGSFDRMIRVYDLAAMAYVETLFGHQDTILSMDAVQAETLITCGARDRTVRFWKIVDETQLVFRGGGRSVIREVLDYGEIDTEEVERPRKKHVEGSIECVAMIDNTTFLSGGDSGSICLWNTQKKKPVFTQTLAHGVDGTPRWVTALASLRYSDLFASGSWDGSIRIWRLEPSLKAFTAHGVISVSGVVNSLQLISVPPLLNSEWIKSPKQKEQHLLVAGIGQELRMGRWLKVSGVNSTVVVAL